MRHWRSYATLLKASWKAELQYRPSFLVGTVLGLALQFNAFIFLAIMVGHFQVIGGWSTEEIALLYAIKLMAQGVYLLVFGRLGQAVRLIWNGDIDVYLTRPVPVLIQLAAGTTFLEAVGCVICALALMTLAAVSWTFPSALYLLLVVLGGALLRGGMVLLGAALAFRARPLARLLGLGEAVLTTFSQYPLTIFPGAVRLFLTFVVPVAFVAYIPASALLGKTGELLPVQAALATVAPLAGLLWIGVAYAVWREEVRGYRGIV